MSRKHVYSEDIAVTTSIARTQIGALGDIPPGNIKHIILHIKSISSMTDLAKITLGTLDADRRYVLPASSGAIDIDEGDATKGTLSLKVDCNAVIDQVTSANSTGIWMGFKSSAGTCTIESVEVIVEQ